MIHFLRPYWLWLLIPATIYLVWIIYNSRRYNPWHQVCDSHLLPALLHSNGEKPKHLFNMVLLLFFMISIFALAGPAWKKAKLPAYQDIRSIVLVLDLSTNMLSTDLKPDRLTRAKFKIKDLIKSIQNVQMGLVAFTQEAFIASPLSQDANTLHTLLDELSPAMMPISGSDMSQGLIQGQVLLSQAGVVRGHILLITASEPTDESIKQAEKISETGSKLHVFAMLDESDVTQTTLTRLKQLAQAGKGSFKLFSPQSVDIEEMRQAFTLSQTIKDDKIENAYLWQDEGPLFCLLLIPLVLIILREKMQS